MVRVDRHDPVVPLPRLGVVDLPVVDHVIGAQGAHEIQLVGARHAGDLGVHGLRDLDDERADVAGRAVDQDAVAGPDRPAVATPKPLEREDRRVRQRGGLLERHAGRHRLEGLLARAGVLGEGAGVPGREHVGEDLVAGLEAGHAGPDRLDDARRIDPDAVIPGRAEAHEQAHEARLGLQSVEVGAVD